jgi:outer membrane receptor protein involved in Fe transport
VNFFASYKTEESGLSINLAYNVQGETLNIVGSGRVSDVYTKPFNSLNLTASKEFGKGSRIQAGINNILSAERFNYYKSYGAPEEIYSIFKPGTSFSVKFAQTF